MNLTMTKAKVTGHTGCGFVDYADGHGEFRTDLPLFEDQQAAVEAVLFPGGAR